MEELKGDKKLGIDVSHSTVSVIIPIYSSEVNTSVKSV